MSARVPPSPWRSSFNLIIKKEHPAGLLGRKTQTNLRDVLFPCVDDLFFRTLDHLARGLQQFVRGTQCTFPHFAKHLRKFEQARFAFEVFHAS